MIDVANGKIVNLINNNNNNNNSNSNNDKNKFCRVSTSLVSAWREMSALKNS